MLHIIWTIIKIILLILAILLGIVLLFLLGLLFLPFGYRIKVDNREGWKGSVIISWLAFLIRGRIWYEQEKFHWKVRILGIRIAGSDRKMKKNNRKNNRIEDKEDKKHKEEYVQNKEKDGWDNNLEDKGTEIDSLKKLWSKIKNVWYTTREWWKVLTSERMKAVFRFCKGEILFIWKKIRPRKINGMVEFGTGDPATTGQCLGVIALLYGYLGCKVQIVPDFEGKILNASLTGKGRIPLGSVLFRVWRIYKNKNLRIVLRKMEHIGGIEDERD